LLELTFCCFILSCLLRSRDLFLAANEALLRALWFSHTLHRGIVAVMVVAMFSEPSLFLDLGRSWMGPALFNEE
jgi:hypothetical protein